MAGNNIDRKLRFLPFLPYGFCSKTATTMKGRYNPYARQLFLGEDPTELEKQNDQERRRTRYKAKDLCHKKYAIDTNLMCGTPAEERSFRRMTKAGLIATTFYLVISYCPLSSTLYHLANNNRSTHHNGTTPPNFFIPVKVGREGWRRTELRRTHVKNE